MVVPDMSAEARGDFADGSPPEHFFLGDVRNTDGSPWECCPREFLRRAIAALDAAIGLHLIVAFEQEFVYTGDRPGHAYSLGAWRRQGGFGGSIIAAFRAAGIKPDSFLPEYGARQYEFTIAPEPALKAADQAVIARELVRGGRSALAIAPSSRLCRWRTGWATARTSISACMTHPAHQ
jgi:glutamine synthetase